MQVTPVTSGNAQVTAKRYRFFGRARQHISVSIYISNTIYRLRGTYEEIRYYVISSRITQKFIFSAKLTLSNQKNVTGVFGSFFGCGTAVLGNIQNVTQNVTVGNSTDKLATGGI